MSAMKLWRISGVDVDNPYEVHADSKEEALVNFLDNELHLKLSLYQFNEAVESLKAGKYCLLTTMLNVDEVLE